MNYTIIELQTNDGVTSVLTEVKVGFNEGAAEWHRRLSFAAKSSVQVHSVTLLNERGNVVKHECYTHNQPEEVEDGE